MYDHDQDWYTPKDPNDRPRPQLQPVRLWPYVLIGLLFALAFWAYFEPIPEHTTIEPIGPSSSLYGPLR